MWDMKSMHLNLYFIHTFKFIFHPYISNLYFIHTLSNIWAQQQLGNNHAAAAATVWSREQHLPIA
jgi:hypothetical protein